MRNVRACIQDALSAVTSYEDFKRGHLGTERLCSDEGFAFCPMVVEAIGGAWGPAAVKVFHELAKSKSILTGEPVDHLLTQLHQNLSAILRREKQGHRKHGLNRVRVGLGVRVGSGLAS